MSMVENLMPRRNAARARNEADDKTPVELALAAPLPSGINEALAKMKAALDGFQAASSAYSKAGSIEEKAELGKAVAQAEAAHSDAVVKREVADQLGDDGPSNEEIAALEAAFTKAKQALESIDARKAAYASAVDQRRESLSEAQRELWETVSGWADNAYAAADRQLAEGVKLIGEALHMAKAMATWQSQGIDANVRQNCLVSGGSEVHRGPDSIELPKDIEQAVSAWRRADRAINRF